MLQKAIDPWNLIWVIPAEEFMQSEFYSLHNLFPPQIIDNLNRIYPDYSVRFERASRQSPIWGTLLNEDGWRESFLRRLDKIRQTCQRFGICDHVDNHLPWVIGNCFSITDAQGFSSDTDSFFLFMTFLHDFGYILPGVIWNGEDLTAVNHGVLSASFIKKLALFAYSEEINNILISKYLKNLSLYHDFFSQLEEFWHKDSSGILSDNGDGEILKRIILSFFLADKLDYFVSRRVGDLPQQRDNDYYSLALQVYEYRLVGDRNSSSLRMIVSLVENVCFGQWKQNVSQYGNGLNYWTKVEMLAELLGLDFDVYQSYSNLQLD